MKNLIIIEASQLQTLIKDRSLAFHHPVTVSIRYVQLSMDSYSNQVTSVAQMCQLLGRDELCAFAEGYDVAVQNNKVLLKVFMLPTPECSLGYTAHQIASLAQKVDAPAVELYIPMYK